MIPPHSLFLLICLVSSTNGQSGNGFEIWPDPDSCEVFHVSPPEGIPVTRPDMPWDVWLAYTVLDTICKTYTPYEIRARIPLISNDSLIIGWHLYNRIADYDPFLLLYQLRYSMLRTILDYKADWQDVLIPLNMEYSIRFRGIENANYRGPNINLPEELIFASEGIYRVRGLSFFERQDTGFAVKWPGPCSKITQCADVEVVEVYKGRRFYSSCNPLQHELPEGAGCLRIKWDVFTCDSSQWRSSRMMPGHEYLVFTGYFRSPGFNSKGPFRWVVAPVKRFEIVNGLLLDPERYFKREATIPFDEIELLIRNRMNELTGM